MVLLSPREVAEQLGISLTTLKRHVDDGNLPYVDIGRGKRRHCRFTQEAVNAFVRQQSRREIGNDIIPTRRKTIVPGQGIKPAQGQRKRVRNRKLSSLRFISRPRDG
jgi:excisionase family DNA binding protein